MFLIKKTMILLLCVLTLQMCESAIHARANSNPAIIEALQHPTSSTDRLETIETIPAHNITIMGDEFMLDGKPLQIISGSMHYFRVPAAYWRDRLRKLKAAGLNAVSTYVEWSFHEPEERRYSFSGDRDVARFVRLAEEEGLHVLLRPGPYICAERDLGGFPYWLLGKYPNIKLRTTDKDFLRETETWMDKLFKQLTPLLLGNGGPIILVQVENEYGSYGDDITYKLKMRDIISKHVGTNAVMYTTDGQPLDYIKRGSIPGTLTTVDFPSDSNITKSFEPLRKLMPHGPLMNSEYYTGWLTHWGETNSANISTTKVVQTLRDMLADKININFYMFFGGTNFEFTAGANYNDVYLPDITSYDYDAPLSEAGDPTAKYYAIRDVLAQHNEKVKEIPLPTPSQKGNYGNVNVTKTLNLLSQEGRQYLGKEYSNFSGSQLPTFERLRQRSGFVLYETVLGVPNDAVCGILTIENPRDLVFVYVDNVLQGLINRAKTLHTLQLNVTRDSVLSLLVENQGRINIGSELHDFKGILSDVKYNNKTVSGKWSVKGYPLENVDVLSAEGQKCTKHGPVLYSGYFTLPEGQEPLDTFLDPTGWKKGYAWINGHNLGRYWPSAGPQVTLYVPGAWLRAAPAANRLQVLELQYAPPNGAMAFVDRPNLSSTATGSKL